MKKMVTLILALAVTLMCAMSIALAEAVDDILIPGGTFMMGSPESEPWRGEDETQHSVTVSDFYMSPYEVTQAEYERLMGVNPSTFVGAELPVEGVSWLDAVAFCNAKSEAEGLTPAYAIEDGVVTWDRAANGYRLPTEAEWEYACRAGTDTPFNTRSSIGADEANYLGHYPYQIEENYFDQSALETLSDRMDELGKAVTTMKIVLDSGELVGATSRKMDDQLGTLQMRNGRGN